MVLLKCLSIEPRSSFCLYLHSTMVLLKFSNITSDFKPFTTSTFHYGSIKINENLVGVINKYKSTFHYGSIKIERKNQTRNILRKSTFHYGSIKIKRSVAKSTSLDDLHSTMVLLKFTI